MPGASVAYRHVGTKPVCLLSPAPMEKVFFLRSQPTWQRYFCYSVYFLLAVGGAYCGVLLRNKLQQKGTEAWFFPMLFTSDVVFFVTGGIVVLIFFAIYLCLRDRLTRGPTETIVVSENQISRSSANRFFSLLTAPTDIAPNVSRMSWCIPRGEIKSITVSSSDMIVIEHLQGTDYLTATDWVTNESLNSVSCTHQSRKSQGGSNGTRRWPLIETLLAMDYPVKFT